MDFWPIKECAAPARSALRLPLQGAASDDAETAPAHVARDSAARGLDRLFRGFFFRDRRQVVALHRKADRFVPAAAANIDLDLIGTQIL